MIGVYRFLENGSKWVFAIAGGMILGAAMMYLAMHTAMSAKIAGNDAEVKRQVDLILEHAPKCAATQPASDAARQHIDELTAELARAEKENLQLRQSAAVAQSVATVLYEPNPVDPRIAAIQTVLTLTGHPLPGIPGMRPRWFVPGKVQPIEYPAAGETSVDMHYQLIYVDATGRHEGPFLPKVLGQQ